MMLTPETLKTGTYYLVERDSELRMVFDQFGYPPLWARTPGFSTLCHIILEQQVSLASANACFARLEALCAGVVTPDRFQSLSDEQLRGIGYSRQKINYSRGLAEAVLKGKIDLEALAMLDDEQVRKELCALKGIGLWTSNIYLSECLMRPDILPPGDIALLEAFRQLKKLDGRPDHDNFTRMTEHWRPWRSVGIRLLWHYYLNRK